MSERGNPYVHTGSSAPYYDDFDADKNYARIMYRPGYAVQARELTQSQTILQNQISALAGISLKNGQPISGSRISISYDQKYMNIDPASLIDDSKTKNSITVNTLIGRTFSDPNGTNSKILVTSVDPVYTSVTNSDGTITQKLVSAKVLFSFLGAETWTSTGVYDTNFVAIGTPACQFKAIQVGSNPIIGTCAIATNAPGQIFYNGYILSVPQQSCVIDYDTQSDSEGNITTVDLNQEYNIGYVITQSYINSTTDASVLDNANGSTNYNAPGADRMKFTVTLTSFRGDTNFISSDFDEAPTVFNDLIPEHFVRGITVENKTITADHLEVNTISDEIVDLLAKRTYDESGSYTVNPWYVNVSDIDDDSTKYRVTVKPGKGYIMGYDIHSTVSQEFDVDKARTVRSNRNDTSGSSTAIVYSYLTAPSGFYTYADFNTSTYALNSTDIPSLNTLPYALVVSASWDSSSTTVASKYVLGTVRVLNMYKEGSKLRVYLGETSKVANKFASAKYLVFGDGIASGSTSTDSVSGYIALYKNIYNKAEVYGQDTPDIVELDNTMVRNVSDIKYVATVWSSTTCNTAGSITLGLSNMTYTGTVLWIYNDTDNTYVNVNNVSVSGAGSQSLTIQSDSVFIAEKKYNVLCTVMLTYNTGTTSSNSASSNTDGSASRSKILTTATLEYTSSNIASVVDKFTLTGYEDIFDIVSVYQTSNLGSDITNTTDLKDELTLDNGQRDHYYDEGSLSGFKALANDTTKVNSTNVPITYSITFRYFEHDSGSYTYAPFSASSYPTIDGEDIYAKIPSYRSSSNKVYSLRDCLDFRVKKSILTTSRAVGLPYPSSSVGYTDAYYLPRIDSVWVDANGNFGVTKGIPSLSPDAPAVLSNALRLYNIHVPAYTLTAATITKTYINNQRYTMKDISSLDNRISNLETQLSLSQLELESINKDVTDTDGLSRFKTGIFTDDFSSFNYCDYTNEDWNATIDGMEQSLRPQFTTESYNFGFNSSTSNNVKATSDCVILPYTTTVYAQNLAVSKMVNVQQLMFATWNGALKLTPSIDNWVTNLGNKITNKYTDTAKPPTVYKLWSTNSKVTNSSSTSSTEYKINHTRQNWGFGKGVGTATTTTVTTNTILTTNTYMKTSYTSQWVLNGSTSVAKQSADMYMRQQTVAYSATGFRPGVKVTATMDGKALTLSDPKVDASGSISGTFVVPAKITCGTKKVKFVDAYGTSEAEADYTGTGVTIWNEVTNNYIRNWTQNTSFVTKQSTTQSTSTTTNVTAWDPLAQSFYIKESNGIFIDSIDVYVATKDAYAPLTLYVCKCENGTPTSDILPFSQVQIASSNITCCSFSKTKEAISAVSALVPTNFKFSTPLYLESECEYAFVLITNSYSYSVFVSEVGAFDAISQKAIVEQPFTGSMFMSQNTRTWTPEQSQDITFRIHKCVFSTSGYAEFNLLTPSSFDTGSSFEIDSMCLTNEIFTPSSTSARCYAQFARTNPGQYTQDMLEFENKCDIDFDVPCYLYTNDTATSTTPSLKMRITMSTEDTNVTPMIDLEQVYGLFSHNDYETYTEDADYPLKTGTYISTTTTLSEESSTFRVILDCIKPTTTGGLPSDIKVYFQTSSYTPIYIDQCKAPDVVSDQLDTYGTDVDKARELINSTVKMYYIKEVANAMNVYTIDDKNKPSSTTSTVPTYTLIPKEVATITGVSSTMLSSQQFESDTAYRIYLGSVANTDDFLNAYNISGTSKSSSNSAHYPDDQNINSICLMDLYLDSSLSVETWDPLKGKHNNASSSTDTYSNIDPETVAYPVNSIVYYKGFFWKNKKVISVGNCSSYVPSTYSSNWEKVVAIKCATSVQQEEEEVNWRPMSLVSDTDDTSKTTSFLEYEYEPTNTIDEPFKSFSIRIDFLANDSCNVARVRNIRAIATV